MLSDLIDIVKEQGVEGLLVIAIAAALLMIAHACRSGIKRCAEAADKWFVTSVKSQKASHRIAKTNSETLSKVGDTLVSLDETQKKQTAQLDHHTQQLTAATQTLKEIKDKLHGAGS